MTPETEKAPQAIKQEGLDGEPVTGVTHCATCGKEITFEEGFDNERADGQPQCAECAAVGLADLQKTDVSLEQFVVGTQVK